LVHKWLKIGPPFYPLSVNSANELNQTLPNGGQQIALTLCRRNVRVVLPKIIGAKNYTSGRFFDNFETNNGGYLLRETCHRQSGKSFRKYKGLFAQTQNFKTQNSKQV